MTFPTKHRVKIDTIEILTVLHGARLSPESLFYAI